MVKPRPGYTHLWLPEDLALGLDVLAADSGARYRSGPARKLIGEGLTAIYGPDWLAQARARERTESGEIVPAAMRLVREIAVRPESPINGDPLNGAPNGQPNGTVLDAIGSAA